MTTGPAAAIGPTTVPLATVVPASGIPVSIRWLLPHPATAATIAIAVRFMRRLHHHRPELANAPAATRRRRLWSTARSGAALRFIAEGVGIEPAPEGAIRIAPEVRPMPARLPVAEEVGIEPGRR